MSADLQSILAAGDVDSLRRLLKHGNSDTDQSAPAKAVTPAIKATAASTALFAHRPILQMPIEHMTLRLRSVRTMGKLLWPAGDAVARLLLRLPPPPQPTAMLEIGAGAAVPSLVAAAHGTFTRGVVATDAFEEVVQLVCHHDELNGARLTAAERLDVAERGALHSIVEARFGLHADAPSILLVACEMSYDPEAITNLFAAAAELLRHDPVLLFSRSQVFEHLDEHQAAVARAHGFALAASVEKRAAGALDAVAEAHLTPCVADGVRLFIWVRERRDGDGDAHPMVEWLMSHGDAEPRVTEQQQHEDLWAPQGL